jgi:hypothetical protein
LAAIVREYISLGLEITAGEYIGNPQMWNYFQIVSQKYFAQIWNWCGISVHVCYYCNIISRPPVLGNRALM